MSPSLEQFKALNMSARIKFMRNSCHDSFNNRKRTRKEIMIALAQHKSLWSFFRFSETPEGHSYWIYKL